MRRQIGGYVCLYVYVQPCMFVAQRRGTNLRTVIRAAHVLTSLDMHTVHASICLYGRTPTYAYMCTRIPTYTDVYMRVHVCVYAVVDV